MTKNTTAHRMTNLLVIGLLLISSYDWRVSCDFVAGAQSEIQQQQLQPQQQQVSASASAAQATNNGAVGAAASVAVGDELAKWQQSGLYLASFDPAITTIPRMQREFVNQIVANDLELFREILREAIERRNKFAPSVGLIWKYAAKLIGRFINNRREEMKLAERLEPKPEFFVLLADLADAVIQRSTEVKREKGYTKNNIDTDELYRRVDNLFKHIQATVEVAPVGAYLKWNELVAFKNDPTNVDHGRPIVDLASELTAVSNNR